MEELTVKIYQFEELSETAKEKAREWYKGTMNENFSMEAVMISEMFEEHLNDIGYPTEDIAWSLNCCQGDGVAFYGKVDSDDLEKIAERVLNAKESKWFKLLLKAGLDISIEIRRNSYGHHYSHWNTMEVECEIEDNFIAYNPERYPKIIDLVRNIEEGISREIKETSKELEQKGYESIDYYYSNESVDENIRSNEYEFTEEGRRWTF